MEENNHIRRMASAMAGETVYDYMFGELKTPEQVELAMRESGMTRKEIRKIKEQALMRLENYRRYGYYSWFDWSRANWGTKWNAYNIEMPVNVSLHVLSTAIISAIHTFEHMQNESIKTSCKTCRNWW